MSKYVDAECLRAIIEKRINNSESCPFIEADFGAWKKREGKIQAYKDILALIDSLQQEQPKVDLVARLKHHLATTPKEQLKKEWKELEHWCNIGPTVEEFLYGEQPEVDFEKFTEKIKNFQERYKHPEIVSIKGAMAFMARMFYQYPNAARLWYEQLPKATND